MLTKRTNILFEENIFNHLSHLAAKKGTSVGNLVRMAVVKLYLQPDNSKKIDSYNKILELRKNVRKVTAAEINDFIDYGR